jgi:predicted nucleotidyltransferase
MHGQTPLNNDLKELLRLFQSHGVEFLVAGAHALAFHARPRFTEDLDLFLRRTKDNAARVRRALEVFGFNLTDEAEQKLANDPRGMIVLGRKPHQVDLLNFLDGVDFDAAWANRKQGKLADLEVAFLGLEDYVATKRATARAKDQDDLNRLREQLGHKLPGDD